jgi:hypothetical protein
LKVTEEARIVAQLLHDSNLRRQLGFAKWQNEQIGENIQHSTTNIEHPMSKLAGA